MKATVPEVTSFQQRVYAVLQRIPQGRVMTYAGLAAAVGCGSARAVGGALRANPFAPTVPCHRVIGSDLGLRGYQGRTRGAALMRKRALLEAEGVRFESDDRVAPSCVLHQIPA